MIYPNSSASVKQCNQLEQPILTLALLVVGTPITNLSRNPLNFILMGSATKFTRGDYIAHRSEITMSFVSWMRQIGLS